MTKIDAWAATAQRGDRFVYHRTADHKGRQIAEIRAVDPDKRSADEAAVCHEAFDAYALHQASLVRLVQRRVDGGFHYEAWRR